MPYNYNPCVIVHVLTGWLLAVLVHLFGDINGERQHTDVLETGPVPGGYTCAVRLKL